MNKISIINDLNVIIKSLRKDSVFKLNSFLAICSAIVFLLFFQFTKHNPIIAVILPFSNDPYDAIGSLGVIIAGLLSLLSIIRVFCRLNTDRQKILISRTQFTVAAAIFVTLTVDSIAIVRHIPMWLGHSGAVELLVLMFGLFILSLVLSFMIRYSIRNINLEAGSWKKVTILFILTIIILAFYPEFIIQSTIGEISTILVGVLILFFLLSALTEAFIPFKIESFNTIESQPHHISRIMEIGAVVLLGIGIGISLLISELNVEGAPLIEHRIMIASIFIGIPLISLLIAYYCLRKPLALFQY